MSEQSDCKASNCEEKHDDTNPGYSLAFSEIWSNKRPSLKCLFIMLLIEFMAFAMLVPIFPFFLIHEIGLGPDRVGQLLSAFSLAQLIGAGASGRISDAIGRRYVIIVVFAWAGVGCGATAFVNTFVEILVVRLMQGLSGGTAALCDAYILDVVPSSAVASYIGFSGGVKGISFVLGPGIGALLIQMGISRRGIFLVTGALAFVAAGLGIAYLDESLPKEKRRALCERSETCEKDEGKHAANWEGVNISLVCLWFTRFVSALGLGFLFATYAFLIKDNFGWSDVHFGIVLLVSGLSGACFQVLVFPRIAKLIGAAWCLFSGAGIGIIAFALFPEKSLVVHVCALVLFTISGGLLEPSFPALVVKFASERHLGLGNGVVASCRALATMLSPLIAGMLYNSSPRLAYHVAASCYAIATVTAAVISVMSRSISSEGDRLISETAGSEKP